MRLPWDRPPWPCTCQWLEPIPIPHTQLLGSARPQSISLQASKAGRSFEQLSLRATGTDSKQPKAGCIAIEGCAKRETDLENLSAQKSRMAQEGNEWGDLIKIHYKLYKSQLDYLSDGIASFSGLFGVHPITQEVHAA